MLAQLGLFVLGLIALIAGAEALVRGASRMALSWGISPLVIGLTVVAFGTSAPEVAVSVGAALDGNPDLAIGNVLGSNIANILLILGISALIVPLAVSEQIIRQEVPILIGVSALLVGLSSDGTLSRFEAGVLLSLAVVYTVFLIVQARRGSAKANEEALHELPEAAGWDASRPAQILLVLGGLGLLVLGADWLVGAATHFARAFGVSDLVIGLTVVAIGTSMPEIATSIMAALRGERDIAVGNVVGSNLFNILGCLGAAGLVSANGLPVSEAARSFDMWVMLAVAFACLPVFITGREIARWEGVVFLGYYIAYTAFLVLSAQHHAAAPMLSSAMLSFVIPLTVLTLIVSLWRHRRTAAGKGA
ncbi:calcium/sodium antiporter [Denitromonas ohlonensis]|uniref:Calcium/sodium antiporter n=2 Tax=Denitromonas TaxID=139331 RepID=A0A557RR03_9RHOO|nr:calcium/sodium antiporter [Denitromonas ohlonensis]TVO67597.1 calcium/sodium antiporter [Denitromonas ohlonensis]TVO76455.1 calcium/sodium antiporter [Denitromonas ohlonensis]TVT46939.1 MAG: calcium/sodium antiporter [Denitromonas halophila]TVT66381.1 MAG: calcium/sodium antiporter [Denitromonas halophila]